MIAALEASGAAAWLRASAVAYPLVNAGHVAGIALLVGAVVPMDLRVLGAVRGPDLRATVAFLRPFAVAGLVLAATCGFALFAVQASDYAGNLWFRVKLALIAAALMNAALHLRLADLPPARARRAAALSLCLWPAALVAGRMIAYS